MVHLRHDYRFAVHGRGGLSSSKGDYEIGMLRGLEIIFSVILIFGILTGVGVLTNPFTKLNEQPEPEELVLPYAINAFSGVNDWTDCSKQDGGWAFANAYCQCFGYGGAASQAEKPCYQQNVGQRYKLATGACTSVGTSACCSKTLSPGPSPADPIGDGFTKVKCR
ncbi:MAG: hypothetical protein HY366_00925 [Candidatus Aenigmarchaeota archaeon]|nr:hypothetical protein [Candidatus Aenigmarchaeota archaeon]